MPFQSEAQRRFLWKFEPDIAQRWADEYPNKKKLPRHKKKAKRTAKRKTKRTRRR
jgi:hypothetical protein